MHLVAHPQTLAPSCTKAQVCTPLAPGRHGRHDQGAVSFSTAASVPRTGIGLPAGRRLWGAAGDHRCRQEAGVAAVGPCFCLRELVRVAAAGAVGCARFHLDDADGSSVAGRGSRRRRTRALLDLYRSRQSPMRTAQGDTQDAGGPPDRGVPVGRAPLTLDAVQDQRCVRVGADSSVLPDLAGAVARSVDTVAHRRVLIRAVLLPGRAGRCARRGVSAGSRPVEFPRGDWPSR